MPEYWEHETDSHVFFWGGPLSNWFKTEFYSDLSKDGQIYRFNCSEQYMMAGKAHLFEDQEILQEILDNSNPRVHKDLGKQVKNYTDAKWFKNARNIVYNGCFDKFFQNDKLFSILLSTGNKVLVEASPYDRLWGVGLPWTDYRIHQPNRWLGKNWLGQVLMKVRYDLSNSDNNCFTEINWL